jgi:hypothetical protein
MLESEPGISLLPDSRQRLPLPCGAPAPGVFKPFTGRLTLTTSGGAYLEHGCAGREVMTADATGVAVQRGTARIGETCPPGGG